MKYINTIIFIFVVNSLFGQGFESSILSQTGYFNITPDVNDILSPLNKKAYYESEIFSPVRIILDDSTHTAPILGRVDLYNEGLQVDVGEKLFSVNKENFHRLKFYVKDLFGGVDTCTYINSSLVLNSKKELLLEVVVEGENPLYLHKNVKFIKANYNKALDIGEKDDKYVVKNVFYTLLNKKLVKLPLNNEKKLNKTLEKVFMEENFDLIFDEDPKTLINFFKLKNKEND